MAKKNGRATNGNKTKKNGNGKRNGKVTEATRRAYAVFLCDPDDTRTRGQVAADLKVNRVTLWKWMHDPVFLKMYEEEAEKAKQSLRGRARKILGRNMEQMGDVAASNKAAEIALKLNAELIDKIDATMRGNMTFTGFVAQAKEDGED